MKALKEFCFRHYIDDKDYWEPKCQFRNGAKCKSKFNKIQTDLQRFISLLETDKKLQGGKEGASGEDRAKWYARINKQYVICNTKKNDSGPFKLFSFEEQLENDDIDIPKYCMENHPKFNDIATVTIDNLVDSDVDTDADARKSNISSLSKNSDSTKKNFAPRSDTKCIRGKD